MGTETTQTLADILRGLAAGAEPSAAALASLRRLAATYPASIAAPAALLKYFGHMLSDEETARFRAAVALGSGDPAATVTAIDPSLADMANFYPPEEAPAPPSTDDTIDLFLRTYGHSSPEEDALLERMIFNPVPEYAEALAREAPAERHTEAPAGSQDALIDAFLAANPADDADTAARPATEHSGHAAAHAGATARHKAPTAAPAPPADTLLSESLAKIFIRQGRYERAYEIISNLSLNYPKKSIYFADQLRFLRKLIKISRATAGAAPRPDTTEQNTH